MRFQIPESLNGIYASRRELVRDVGLFISGLGLSFTIIGALGDLAPTILAGGAVAAIGVGLAAVENGPHGHIARIARDEVMDIDKEYEELMRRQQP